MYYSFNPISLSTKYSGAYEALQNKKKRRVYLRFFSMKLILKQWILKNGGFRISTIFWRPFRNRSHTCRRTLSCSTLHH